MGNTAGELTYIPETESVTGSPILGKLRGPIASTVNETRNGRRYSKQLWENAFNDDIVKEMFKNKVFFGELGHPQDRQEVDMAKVAICIPNPPVRNEKGQLIATCDILDTPSGRILKTLVDYGSRLGISSRGEGDILDNDEVDPNSYTLNAFDIVQLPALSEARLESIQESFSRKTLSQALNESLNSATANDREIMEESLTNLGINIKSVEDYNRCESNDDDIDKTEEVVNDKSDHFIKTLQEVMLKNSDLEENVLKLQEELAASNARVNDTDSDLKHYKEALIGLSERSKKVKSLKKENTSLSESLIKTQEILNEKNLELKDLNESKEADSKKTAVLEEKINKLNSRIKNLRESLIGSKKDTSDKLNELTESFNKQIKELTKEKEKLNESVKYYKNLSNTTGKRYIQLKASQCGVNVDEVKKRLSESYTLSDVDNICEDIKAHKYNMSKLPFNENGIVSRSIRSSSNASHRSMAAAGDDVDSLLDEIINLK